MKNQLKIAQLTTLFLGMVIMTIAMFKSLSLEFDSPSLQNYALLMIFGSLVVGFSLVSISNNKKY